MKTRPPRYRPLDRWPRYREWDPYQPQPAHTHKWVRIQGDGPHNALIVCTQCGEPQ